MRRKGNVLETHSLERPFSIKCAYALLAFHLTPVRFRFFCALAICFLYLSPIAMNMLYV